MSLFSKAVESVKKVAKKADKAVTGGRLSREIKNTGKAVAPAVVPVLTVAGTAVAGPTGAAAAVALGKPLENQLATGKFTAPPPELTIKLESDATLKEALAMANGLDDPSLAEASDPTGKIDLNSGSPDPSGAANAPIPPSRGFGGRLAAIVARVLAQGLEAAGLVFHVAVLPYASGLETNPSAPDPNASGGEVYPALADPALAIYGSGSGGAALPPNVTPSSAPVRYTTYAAPTKGPGASPLESSQVAYTSGGQLVSSLAGSSAGATPAVGTLASSGAAKLAAMLRAGEKVSSSTARDLLRK